MAKAKSAKTVKCGICYARTHATALHDAVEARHAAQAEEGRQEMVRLAAVRATAEFVPGDDGDDRPEPATQDVAEDYPGQRIDGPEPDKTAARARQLLIDGATDATRTLAAFKKGFDASPVDAFRWSESAIEAAAVFDVYGTLLALLDEKGFAVALGIAAENALNGAQYPQHSTSSVSNLVAEAKTAAFATFARRFSRKE
jgi:hypothetical protein